MFIRRQQARNGTWVYWVCEEERTERGPRQRKLVSLRRHASVAAALVVAERAVRVLALERAQDERAYRAALRRPGPRGEAGKERRWRLQRQLARERGWLERLRELPPLIYGRRRRR